MATGNQERVAVVTRVCPICGTDNQSEAANIFSRPPWRLKQCAGCGLVYLENPPGYKSLEEEFGWQKQWAAEHARRTESASVSVYATQVLHSVPKKLFKRNKLMTWATRYFAPGPVLDVGCAGAETLMKLPPEYVPFGIEIEKETAALADSRVGQRGGKVVAGDALTGLAQFDSDFFSGIIMASYLEHELHPRQALAAAMRVMRAGARVIIKVPNFGSWNRSVRGTKWCGFHFPDHVNYFTPQLLRRIVEHQGLNILRFAIPDHMPTSDTMWMVAEKRR